LRNWLHQAASRHQANQSASREASREGRETLVVKEPTFRCAPRRLVKGFLVAFLLMILGGVAVARGPVARADPSAC